MAELSFYPYFAWKIQSVTKFCKRQSPSFSFHGKSWNLKFVYTQSTDGNVCRVVLKRSGDGFNSSVAGFRVQGELRWSTDQNISRYFSEIMTLSDSSLNEWQIWEQKESEILSQLKSTSINSCLQNYHFVCAIASKTCKEGDFAPVTRAGDKFLEPSPCFASHRNDFAKVFNNHLMSDVILVCGDRKIYAHRIILAARSEIFAAMFRTDMKESKERSVNIADVDPLIMEQLLRYMYSGETPALTPDCAHDLYKAADKYGVGSLKMKCGLLMVENPEPKNTTQPLATAGVVSSTKESVARHFANIKAVLSTHEWKKLSEKEPQFAYKVLRFLVNESS